MKLHYFISYFWVILYFVLQYCFPCARHINHPTLSLLHVGEKPACNISLVASCASFVHVAPRNVVIQKVGGIGQQSTPIMVKLYLYALKSHLPTGKVPSICLCRHLCSITTCLYVFTVHIFLTLSPLCTTLLHFSLLFTSL